MLDAFASVLVANDEKVSLEDEMTEVFKEASIDDIPKLASAVSKVAYCSDGNKWLEQYEGTPLHDQAVALEEESLNLEAERIQRRMEESEKRDDTYERQDMVRLKKRMLDLELNKLRLQGISSESEEVEEEEDEDEGLTEEAEMPVEASVKTAMSPADELAVSEAAGSTIGGGVGGLLGGAAGIKKGLKGARGKGALAGAGLGALGGVGGALAGGLGGGVVGGHAMRAMSGPQTLFAAAKNDPELAAAVEQARGVYDKDFSKKGSIDIAGRSLAHAFHKTAQQPSPEAQAEYNAAVDDIAQHGKPIALGALGGGALGGGAGTALGLGLGRKIKSPMGQAAALGLGTGLGIAGGAGVGSRIGRSFTDQEALEASNQRLMSAMLGVGIDPQTGRQIKTSSVKLAKEDEKKWDAKTLGTLAALPAAGAGLGAGMYGLAGAGRKGVAPIGTRLARGAGIGGAIGLGTSGLIAGHKALSGVDPEGKTLETAMRLAPAAAATYGALKDVGEDKEASAAAKATGLKRGLQLLTGSRKGELAERAGSVSKKLKPLYEKSLKGETAAVTKARRIAGGAAAGTAALGGGAALAARGKDKEAAVQLAWAHLGGSNHMMDKEAIAPAVAALGMGARALATRALPALGRAGSKLLGMGRAAGTAAKATAANPRAAAGLAAQSAGRGAARVGQAVKQNPLTTATLAAPAVM